MNSIQPIFRDKKLQSLFEKNGFVKVRLLSKERADELALFFESTRQEHATVSTLHHTTTDTQNVDLIHRVDTKIKSLFVEPLKNILTDFKPLVGCFHIKEPGTASETGIHQDPTFVDESKYCSANVWVALEDIDDSNGNLFFISGSNRVASGLRITPSSPNYYENFQDSLPGMATHVPLRKGEAVIFNNATIHGATKNLRNKLRLAATLLVCSAPADWLLYYRDEKTPASKIEKYQLDLDAFSTMAKDGRPDKRAFKQLTTTEFHQISREDFLKITGKGENRDPGYFQKVKNILGIKANA